MFLTLPNGASNDALVAQAAADGGLQGLLKDFPEAQYHALPFCSKSGLTEFARSPAHYKHRKDNAMEPTPAMVLGSATHCAVFEPERFVREYAVIPEGIDRRTKDGKERWSSWLAEHAGKIGLTFEQHAQIVGMLRSLSSEDVGRSLLFDDAAHSEISCFWRDPIHRAVQCKSRIDKLHLQRRIAVDLKTTDRATAWEFESTIFRYKYHWQAAMYLDGLEYATGEKLTDFVFVAIEREAPWDWMVYRMKDEVIQRGRDEYRAQLPLFAAAKSGNFYPGYSKEVQDVGLPRYADYR